MTTNTRTFELRTYVAMPGKVDALVQRFRDHAVGLFEKHGMTSIGYWVESDDDGNPTDNLVYIVAHDSKDAAKASWAAFWADPEWAELQATGERVTASANAVFLDPTSFSPIS
ncbi:NIPSNAP family protein [Gordonia sp. TBRC 11910]|uniref:NIPSNAP family protein n=1 Tax=Gordonia asplenii TaxID=2725283 RepID=A0A848L7I6_9ACTN|nr:NIPSNAP family protein [Gordonia asplenii]NMO03538.1 NIPSNAP family protein [Gordonia asplenii]